MRGGGGEEGTKEGKTKEGRQEKGRREGRGLWKDSGAKGALGQTAHCPLGSLGSGEWLTVASLCIPRAGSLQRVSRVSVCSECRVRGLGGSISWVSMLTLCGCFFPLVSRLLQGGAVLSPKQSGLSRCSDSRCC